VRGTGSSELKRKFHAALADSQINDSEVLATSSMYPVSHWESLTEDAQIAEIWKGYCEDSYHDEEKATEQE